MGDRASACLGNGGTAAHVPSSVIHKAACVTIVLPAFIAQLQSYTGASSARGRSHIQRQMHHFKTKLGWLRSSILWFSLEVKASQELSNEDRLQELMDNRVKPDSFWTHFLVPYNSLFSSLADSSSSCLYFTYAQKVPAQLRLTWTLPSVSNAKDLLGQSYFWENNVYILTYLKVHIFIITKTVSKK